VNVSYPVYDDSDTEFWMVEHCFEHIQVRLKGIHVDTPRSSSPRLSSHLEPVMDPKTSIVVGGLSL